METMSATGAGQTSGEALKEALEANKRLTKAFLFVSNIRFIKVADPNVDLRGLSNEETWGADPIHPKKEIYLRVARGVMVIAAHTPKGGGQGKRPRSDSGGDQRGQGGHRGYRGGQGGHRGSSGGQGGHRGSRGGQGGHRGSRGGQGGRPGGKFSGGWRGRGGS
jgi:hypothetical protein